MSTIVECSGSGSFYGGRVLFWPVEQQGDEDFRPCKRYRADDSERCDGTSIEILPDECLFEIFRRLCGGKEKSVCASVSKRWLTLLSSISRHEFCKDKMVSEDNENEGFLSRCLEGKKATDVRLAAIAVGTYSRGGLGKLSIRNNNLNCKVTDFGLTAIARACPSLRSLSLWDVPSVGDAGLSALANGCTKLEKLDISHCPGITDKALTAIVKGCPNLSTLRIESCASIGNEGVRAVGQYCTNLKSISIKHCPLIGDQGIVSLFSSQTQYLTKVKLQSLNISDLSLAVIGHYGKMIIDLHLSGLRNVNEKGFWVMGNCQGLQMLKSLMIGACQGVTDIGFLAIGKGCPNLKQLCLRKCALLSDNGLVSFLKAAQNLETLQLEECHRLTKFGLFGSIVNSCQNLKALTVVKCFGIKDVGSGLDVMSSESSLRSLSILTCPGFGDTCLDDIHEVCPRLQNLTLKSLDGVTDAGFLAVLKGCASSLVEISVSGCLNLTDASISSMIKLCSPTLEVLDFNGCNQITDASLEVIASSCLFLRDLDVSYTAITDHGIALLAEARQLNLQILSISGCSSISNKSVPSLMKIGSTLIGLNIQHCNAISSSNVGNLREQLWRCDILY